MMADPRYSIAECIRLHKQETESAGEPPAFEKAKHEQVAHIAMPPQPKKPITYWLDTYCIHREHFRDTIIYFLRRTTLRIILCFRLRSSATRTKPFFLQIDIQSSRSIAVGIC